MTVSFAGIADVKVQIFSVITVAGFLTALPTLLMYIIVTRQFVWGFSQIGV